MVVRFVCVPLCVRVSRVSRVCPGSPRCLFTIVNFVRPSKIVQLPTGERGPCAEVGRGPTVACRALRRSSRLVRGPRSHSMGFRCTRALLTICPDASRAQVDCRAARQPWRHRKRSRMGITRGSHPTSSSRCGVMARSRTSREAPASASTALVGCTSPSLRMRATFAWRRLARTGTARCLSGTCSSSCMPALRSWSYLMALVGR